MLIWISRDGFFAVIEYQPFEASGNSQGTSNCPTVIETTYCRFFGHRHMVDLRNAGTVHKDGERLRMCVKH